MSHDKNVHDKKMHDKKSYDKKENENIIEGRNAVMEAFRSGKPVDKLFVLDGCQDSPVRTIVREAKKAAHDPELRGKGPLKPVVRDRKTPGCDRKCCRI